MAKREDIRTETAVKLAEHILDVLQEKENEIQRTVIVEKISSEEAWDLRHGSFDGVVIGFSECFAQIMRTLAKSMEIEDHMLPAFREHFVQALKNKVIAGIDIAFNEEPVDTTPIEEKILQLAPKKKA